MQIAEIMRDLKNNLKGRNEMASWFDVGNDKVTADLKKRLARSEDAYNDLSENYQCVQQNLALATERVTEMTKRRDPVLMTAFASAAAEEIENVFARGWDGTQQRKNALKGIIFRHLNAALKGE